MIFRRIFLTASAALMLTGVSVGSASAEPATTADVNIIYVKGFANDKSSAVKNFGHAVTDTRALWTASGYACGTVTEYAEKQGSFKDNEGNKWSWKVSGRIDCIN
ncbi:hypothetical protein [Amycolatopsis sp. NPDC004378]